MIGTRGDIPDELIDEVTNRCVAKTVLLGWRNLEDDDGNPIEYSHEKALELLRDPTLMVFKEFVEGEARALDHFKEDSDDDTEKKSSLPSAGSSSGEST